MSEAGQQPTRIAHGPVRYVPAPAPTDQQRAVAQASGLFQVGDMVLVWVNEGDLQRIAPAEQPQDNDAGDALAALDWNRLRAGDRRALDPENQWAFDRLAPAEQPQPVSEWIAVTDRLPANPEWHTGDGPTPDDWVLAYSETHDFLAGQQHVVMRARDFYVQHEGDDDIGTDDSKVITHWRPLDRPGSLPPPAAAPTYGSIAERAIAGKDAGLWSAEQRAALDYALTVMMRTHDAVADHCPHALVMEHQAAIDAALKAREGK